VTELAGVANGVTACRRTRSSHIAMADMTTPTDRSPPACRICGGTAIADARDALECRECGSVMVRIVPSAEELTYVDGTHLCLAAGLKMADLFSAVLDEYLESR
jgi:hypothetical protein